MAAERSMKYDPEKLYDVLEGRRCKVSASLEAGYVGDLEGFAVYRGSHKNGTDLIAVKGNTVLSAVRYLPISEDWYVAGGEPAINDMLTEAVESKRIRL
ncbi:MAG: hypothetical protein HY367_03760 [Candidatus Aenigmarchaeota archaeon]|nr:hypothetical protein [Candidatus Aenigmarchaeota archaeon]